MREWLHEFNRSTGMPGEASERVLLLWEGLDWEKYKNAAGKLRTPGSWEEGLLELTASLGEDKDGLKMLTVMLAESRNSYKEYEKLGISSSIFYDTFACFSRFVKEYKESYGSYGFDRAFWVPRQMSLLLFRLGTLEYELTLHNGEDIISVHIPSDADMREENCRRSYEMAGRFLKEQFPRSRNRRFYCSSWLLAPALKEILPESSNIIRFQRGYEIMEIQPDSPDYMRWVFKMPEGNLEEAPQETSLQRRMKGYLDKGGKIGVGAGWLKPDAYDMERQE